MSPLAFIRSHGGNVVRDGFQFRLRPGRMDAGMIARVKPHMEAIKAEVWTAYADWQERAAIMEFEGGLPREDAERAAWECMEARRADAA